MSVRTLAIWGIAFTLVFSSVGRVTPCQPDPSLEQILDKLKPNPNLPDGPLSAPTPVEEPGARPHPLPAPPPREEPSPQSTPTSEGQAGSVEMIIPEPQPIVPTVLQLPPIPPPEVMRSPVVETPLGFA